MPGRILSIVSPLKIGGNDAGGQADISRRGSWHALPAGHQSAAEGDAAARRQADDPVRRRRGNPERNPARHHGHPPPPAPARPPFPPLPPPPPPPPPARPPRPPPPPRPRP